MDKNKDDKTECFFGSSSPNDPDDLPRLATHNRPGGAARHTGVTGSDKTRIIRPVDESTLTEEERQEARRRALELKDPRGALILASIALLFLQRWGWGQS